MAVSGKLTPARLAALKLAEADGVLITARVGTYGSSDCREEVRRPTVTWLRNNGYLRFKLSDSSWCEEAHELTDKGRAALAESK